MSCHRREAAITRSHVGHARYDLRDLPARDRHRNELVRRRDLKNRRKVSSGRLLATDSSLTDKLRFLPQTSLTQNPMRYATSEIQHSTRYMSKNRIPIRICFRSRYTFECRSLNRIPIYSVDSSPSTTSERLKERRRHAPIQRRI